ncbi:hypothetical protein QE152_g29076 [Popillia japonica]|uniref:Uncharacterized protein n=1 Tax=Popillia japonica TaxID=7064 RepID=A0AAW1JJB8_POPJA
MAENFATTFEQYHRIPSTDIETEGEVEGQLFFLSTPINISDSLGYITTSKAGNKNVIPKCANCGGQHHAASKECPKYPLQVKNKRKEERWEKINEAQRRKDTSYSQAVRQEKEGVRYQLLSGGEAGKGRRQQGGYQPRIENGGRDGPVNATNTKSSQWILDHIQTTKAGIRGRELTRVDGGFLNYKSPNWNSRVFNPNGKKLELWLKDNPRIKVKAPKEHTYYPNSGDSFDVLDIFLSKSLPTSEAVTVMKMNTNHCPVVIEMTGNTPRRKTTRKINWMKFMSLCSKLQYPEGAIPKDGIENSAIQLTADIQRVLRECEVEKQMSFTDRWELNESENS